MEPGLGEIVSALVLMFFEEGTLFAVYCKRDAHSEGQPLMVGVRRAETSVRFTARWGLAPQKKRGIVPRVRSVFWLTVHCVQDASRRPK